MSYGELLRVAEPTSAAEVIENMRRTKHIMAAAEANARISEAARLREQQEREKAAKHAAELKVLENKEKWRIARDYIFIETPETAGTDARNRVLVKRSKPTAARLRVAIAKIERHYGLDYGSICSPRRFGDIMKARIYCVHLVSKLRPDWSLPQLGRFFGGRDHTTILHTLRSKTGHRPHWNSSMMAKRLRGGQS